MKKEERNVESETDGEMDNLEALLLVSSEADEEWGDAECQSHNLISSQGRRRDFTVSVNCEENVILCCNVHNLTNLKNLYKTTL